MKPEIACVLTSARKNGYTAGLLKKAVELLEGEGCAVHMVYLHDYVIAPCKSCFACIKGERHTCGLPDDFGRNGEGELFQLIQSVDGVLVADPVYSFGATAACHLFFERCYPYLWSGKIKGKPLASISLASNQGMEVLARQEIARLAFTRSFYYCGGIAAHMYQQEQMDEEISKLVRTLLDAVRERGEFTKKKKMRRALDGPYNAFENFVYYLSNGGRDAGEYRPAQFLQLWDGRLPQEVKELLEKAQRALEQAVETKEKEGEAAAVKYLVQANTFWANATWKMFLGRELNLASPPVSYKSLTEVQTR